MVKIRYLMLLLSEGLYRIRFIVAKSLMEEYSGFLDAYDEYRTQLILKKERGNWLRLFEQKKENGGREEMNRTEARQLDCEIRECLENFSIEQGLNPEFGKLIMDNYLEIIPDNSKREMIFLGKESSSYKMGNIRLDLRSVLIALADFVASLNKPETFFQYVQLVIISIFCVGAITKKELDFNCAVIVSVLHRRNAYEIGFTVEQVKAEINKMKDDGQLEEFVMERIDKNIANLLKWNVICMEEEKIYLNERVWGKIQ